MSEKSKGHVTASDYAKMTKEEREAHERSVRESLILEGVIIPAPEK